MIDPSTSISFVHLFELKLIVVCSNIESISFLILFNFSVLVEHDVLC